MNQPKLSKGTIINETLLIEGVIGGGGMGAVYKAKDLMLERTVAVKILFAPADKKEFVKRFQREAQALSALKHSNIVGFYGFGVWQDVVPFIVMEYLEGQSLNEILASESAEVLSADRILRLVSQICAALSASHREGIVHRDIKPANIMILESPEPDTVKLLDFGLAKLKIKPLQASEDLTKSGILLGTVSYMSPEQGAGKKADTRSDIYSLGCIMHQMLSGAEPFTGDNPIAVIHKHVHEDAPDITERILARDQRYRSLAAIAKKCMQKNPQHRYQTVDEISADFSKIEAGEAVRFAADKKKTSPLAMIAALALVIILGSSCFGGSIVMEWAESESLKHSNDENAWQVALDKAAIYQQQGKKAAALNFLKIALKLAEKHNLNWLQHCKIEIRIVQNLNSMGLKAAATAQLKHAISLCYAFFEDWDREHALNINLPEFREFLSSLFRELTLLKVDLNGLSLGQHNELRDQLTQIERVLLENEYWAEAIMMIQFLNWEAEKGNPRILEKSRNPIYTRRQDLESCYFQSGRPGLALKEAKNNLDDSIVKGNLSDVANCYYEFGRIYLITGRKGDFEKLYLLIEPTFQQIIVSRKLSEQERFEGLNSLLKLSLMYKDKSLARKILRHLQSHNYNPNFYNDLELVEGWGKLRDWKNVDLALNSTVEAFNDNSNPNKHEGLVSRILNDLFGLLNQGYDRDPFPLLNSIQKTIESMDSKSLPIELLRVQALASCLRAKPADGLLYSMNAVAESEKLKGVHQSILSHFYLAPILLAQKKNNEALGELQSVIELFRQSKNLNNRIPTASAPIQGVALLLAEGKGSQSARLFLDKVELTIRTKRHLRCGRDVAELLILADEGKNDEFQRKSEFVDRLLTTIPQRPELNFDFWLKIAKARMLLAEGKQLEFRKLLKEIMDDPFSPEKIFDPFSKTYLESLKALKAVPGPN